MCTQDGCARRAEEADKEGEGGEERVGRHIGGIDGSAAARGEGGGQGGGQGEGQGGGAVWGAALGGGFSFVFLAGVLLSLWLAVEGVSRLFVCGGKGHDREREKEREREREAFQGHRFVCVCVCVCVCVRACVRVCVCVACMYVRARATGHARLETALKASSERAREMERAKI